MEVNGFETIRALVRMNLGVAALPSWAAREDLDAEHLRAVPGGDHELVRTWGVLMKTARRLGVEEQAFVDSVSRACTALIGRDINRPSLSGLM
jgi:DNA-binding transcriptional LysR family regulator